MHRCQLYVDNIAFFDPALGFPNRQLTPAEATAGEGHVRVDGSALLFTAGVAIADALRASIQVFTPGRQSNYITPRST